LVVEEEHLVLISVEKEINVGLKVGVVRGNAFRGHANGVVWKLISPTQEVVYHYSVDTGRIDEVVVLSFKHLAVFFARDIFRVLYLLCNLKVVGVVGEKPFGKN
jgi:hypothetical protein